MNSPDYLKAAGDLHHPSPLMLNRSLPNPGGLLRAQSMPAGFAKPGGSFKQELDPQERVRELCSAAREGDHSMVRALLQGAKAMDHVIDAVDEGKLQVPDGGGGVVLDGMLGPPTCGSRPLHRGGLCGVGLIRGRKAFSQVGDGVMLKSI